MTSAACESIVIDRRDSALAIAMGGEIDLTVVTDEHSNALHDAPEWPALIDMSEVTFIDSTGLAFLLAVREITARAPWVGQIVQCGHSSMVP